MEKYNPTTREQAHQQNSIEQNANSKRILAGILAIVLGHLGIHKFV